MAVDQQPSNLFDPGTMDIRFGPPTPAAKTLLVHLRRQLLSMFGGRGGGGGANAMEVYNSDDGLGS